MDKLKPQIKAYIVNYSFDVAGDIALWEYEGYHEHWYRIEHIEWIKIREEERQQEESQYTAPRMRL